jgi:Zn-dependent M28 family amino/carboxypeptidase
MAARLAAADPPQRRSVIILLTTAEEAGLLGSRFFLDHPPVPLAGMVAAINVDGLAFLDHFNDLVAIGGGLSDLGERLAVAVRHMGLAVSPPPDELWDDAAYGRGDQLAFAQAGIPSILVNEGFDWHSVTRADALEIALEWMLSRYHSPQDDLLQPIEFSASARHCEAVLQLILQIANDPQAPEWKKGVPYAYERQLRRAKAR